jgi:hypothetical protein
MNTITKGRIKINIGQLQGKGLFNIEDTASNYVSNWFPISQLKEIKRQIASYKEQGDEIGLIGLIYDNYEGPIIRKNRFENGKWTLDNIKIVDGSVRYESFVKSAKIKKTLI